jgi:hypothetical protein
MGWIGGWDRMRSEDERLWPVGAGLRLAWNIQMSRGYTQINADQTKD